MEGIKMKKNTLFVVLVILITELYSHECLVRQDSNLYGKKMALD